MGPAPSGAVCIPGCPVYSKSWIDGSEDKTSPSAPQRRLVQFAFQAAQCTANHGSMEAKTKPVLPLPSAVWCSLHSRLPSVQQIMDRWKRRQNQSFRSPAPSGAVCIPGCPVYSKSWIDGSEDKISPSAPQRRLVQFAFQAAQCTANHGSMEAKTKPVLPLPSA